MSKPHMMRRSSSLSDTADLRRKRVYDRNLFDIMSISPRSLAKQLAIMDMRYFQKVDKEELANLSWTKPDAFNISPTVSQFIRRFNILTLNFSHEILKSNSPKRRAEKIEHFILIAKYCRKYENYNGLKCVLSSLQSAPIHRLARTWELVGRLKATFDHLSDIMSPENNHEKYRQKLGKAKPPCVPFLGQSLNDIVFHYEMAQKQNTNNNNMNQYIDQLLDLRQTDYDFKEVPEALDYLSSEQYIAEFEKMYEDDNYRLSLLVEPKVENSDTKSMSLKSYNKLSAKATDDSSIRSSTMSHRRSLIDRLSDSDCEQEPTTNKFFTADSQHSLELTQVREEEISIKTVLDNFKKAHDRSWKKHTMVLRGDSITLSKKSNTLPSAPFLRIDLENDCFIGVATDYKKRKNVFRLVPSKGKEYLIECETEESMNNWISDISETVKKMESRNLIKLA